MNRLIRAIIGAAAAAVPFLLVKVFLKNDAAPPVEARDIDVNNDEVDTELKEGETAVVSKVSSD